MVSGVLAGVFLMPVAWAEQAGPRISLTSVETLDQYTTRAVAGDIKIKGSNTLAPLLNRLALEFRRVQPQVTFDIKGEGSAQSVADFLRGRPQGQIVLKEERTFPMILSSSRELFDAERKAFVDSHGYEPLEIPVAMDAVAIYVHKDNPVPGLTLDQVDAIFSKDHLRSGKSTIGHWGALGLPEEWRTRPIHLYGRDRRSGTYGFFKVHALGGGEFAEGLEEAPGAASVILSVARDPFGIGYSGLGLQSSEVRVVPLAETDGMPYVMPSAASRDAYPLRRVVYLYIDHAPGTELPPAVQEFLAFVTSRDGQQAVVRAGFFSLPSAQLEQNRFALAPLTKSTVVR
jgi:phosphate transport system substrate-binding protein